MKKLTYLILLIVATSTSCIKPGRLCCTLPQRSAVMTAQRNGVMWSPSYVIGTRGISTITIASENLTSLQDPATKVDTLNIKFAYSSADTGTYKLNGSQVYYATFAAGVPTGYKLDTTFNNVIKVNSYQAFDNPATTVPNSFEIKGTFSLKFIDPSNPAGISFSNGSYYAVMNQ